MSAPRYGWAALVLATALCATLTPAAAYWVANPGYGGCHERMIEDANPALLFDLPLAPGSVPTGSDWRKVSNYLLQALASDPAALDDRSRFMLTSLVVGVREPDTDGHSVMNLANLHELHGDPSAIGQYVHALRGPDDDYEQGDHSTVAGTRKLIGVLIDEAEHYLALPPEEQVIVAPVYLEFYGRYDLRVWAPLFLIGRAAHVLQDTFSHMIRSDQDELHEVVHALNYIDAISAAFNEQRDGLAHSGKLDRCFDDDLAELLVAATAATADLFDAARRQLVGEEPDAAELLLDEWLTLKPGCTLANDMCGNRRWLELARQDPTGPYLESLLGCAVAGRRVGAGSGSGGWLICAVLALAGSVLGIRRR